MASTSETGHAKNVANFQQLIAVCISYGAAYNPARNQLSIAGLQNLLSQAQAALAHLNEAKVTGDAATNNRREAFSTFPKFATQVVNALGAAGASSLSVNDAKGVLRKIRGKRAKEIKESATAASALPQPAETKHISVAQLSYDNKIEHFSKLISIVQQQTAYHPNEANLTIVSLQAKLDELNALNNDVINTHTALSNARIHRTSILYNPSSGLVKIAADVKLYAKSIFGATSPQYKQLAAVHFLTCL